jgi:hypothetical protein
MTILFIYNANSGKLNAILDAGHKLFSPSTYQCSLCALTYDTFIENIIWKTFRKESRLNMVFKFPNVKMVYPTILKLENHQLTSVLTNNVLNEIANTEALIQRLKLNL